MSSAFVTPGSPLKSSCASYPAKADMFFYAQGKPNKIEKDYKFDLGTYTVQVYLVTLVIFC